MPDWITTYHGYHINPLSPDPRLIDIRDIAHALALITRGSGHVRTFWSVAQHCILCAKEAAVTGLTDRMVLACLLHDASECYMSDVPRPLKRNMPSYREAEKRMLSVIYTRFLGSDLSETEERQLKRIDDTMLAYDLYELLGEKQSGGLPQVHVDIDYTFRPFSEVEEEYMSLYTEYARGV